MTLETLANKTVATDRNPYNLYSYPQGAVVGVLKLWVVEISAAGLCCISCRDFVINRCVCSRLIKVVVPSCHLITGDDFCFPLQCKGMWRRLLCYIDINISVELAISSFIVYSENINCEFHRNVGLFFHITLFHTRISRILNICRHYNFGKPDFGVTLFWFI